MQRRGMMSAFDAHHATKIYYPALDVLDMFGLRSRDVHLLAPDRAANRYEPLPLVQHRAVEANANRDSNDECAFVSITNASWKEDRPELISPPMGSSRAMQLLFQLRQASRYPGKTALKVLTSCIRNTVLVHIAYKIEVRGTGRAVSVISQGLHTIKLSELEAMQDRDQWPQDLRGLIRRSTDHAVRHVKAQLNRREGHEVRDVNIAWKPRRHPPYQANIRQSPRFKILSPEDLSADERSCVICSDNYGSDNKAAVELPCGKHHMCMACLIQWSQSKGAQDANCHFCRSRIYEGMDLESLQFGISATDSKAYNVADEGNQGYNRWETFRRANADLDRRTVNQQGPYTFVTVNPKFTKLVLMAWELLVLSDHEDHTGTPEHLQPARYPESRYLREILADVLSRYEGARLPLATLFGDVLTRIGRALWAGFLKGEMSRYWSPAEIARRSIPGSVVRPGFKEFVERTLSRALMFTMVRICGADCTATRIWHHHGERLYYKIDLDNAGTAADFPRRLAEPGRPGPDDPAGVSESNDGINTDLSPLDRSNEEGDADGNMEGGGGEEALGRPA
ncbi:Baeyer-Villiger monooxygenase [Teratosphaeria destructans]|uniref:Baeyer-Villiger monooxygenase n=1 Tax=Teratosphaeria destructans TaxID=418781 RepID=A0A9W7W4V0_9PEZI|nr:Baeyer-Villiger monooxygenase [Teratosphaeria destructans]